MAIFRSRLLFCVALASAIGSALLSGHAIAQEGSSSPTEPIYLDEPEPAPPARVVLRQPVKNVYEDDTPRIVREVAKLSDDRIVNDGKYVEYYRDGQKYVEGTYNMGVFDGTWKYWFPNGQICKSVPFKDGRPTGQWEEFNKEGIRVWQKSFQDGRRHGKWTTYYDDGEKPKFELSYDQGQPTGERITYFPNGQKRQVIRFKDGKMHGKMTEWNEQGEKLAEAVFENGKMSGEIIRFDK